MAKKRTRVVIIFSARIAKKLINNGFTVLNIEPLKGDEKRTAFIFKRTPALEKFLKDLGIELKF